jgi:hypothetical protein
MKATQMLQLGGGYRRTAMKVEFQTTSLATILITRDVQIVNYQG